MNDRRRFLRHSAAWAAAGSLPGVARAAVADTRSLSLAHTHTGERLELVYASGGSYDAQALGALDHFLRDHYSGEVGRIDPALFDLLHRVRTAVGGRAPFEVISGYRCGATNERLRQTRGGGVAKTSLHTQGRAIDVRLPGVDLADLRDAAGSLGLGGVGYYPRERFVHLDTGRVRRW
jgi:uncharacterized protein YcbK (DUF882 family)